MMLGYKRSTRTTARALLSTAKVPATSPAPTILNKLYEADACSIGSLGSSRSLLNRSTDDDYNNNNSKNEADGTSPPKVIVPVENFVETINQPPPTTMPSIMAQSPILCAASALLFLKGELSEKDYNDETKVTDLSDTLDYTFKVTEDAMNAFTDQDAQQVSHNEDDDTAATVSDGTFSSSLSSIGSPIAQSRRRQWKKSTTTTKRLSAVKASKKSFRKVSLDLTKTDMFTVSNNKTSSTQGYKRIPSSFLKNPQVLKEGMRLAVPLDEKHVNSLHQFVRRELLEVFVLKDTYRVGLRCVHCASAKPTTKENHKSKNVSMSVMYPKSLGDLYRGVCTMQRLHLSKCNNIPSALQERYWNLKASDPSRGKKKHWIDSALSMGFRDVDNHRNGIIYCPVISDESSGAWDSSEDGMEYDSDGVEEVFV